MTSKRLIRNLFLRYTALVVVLGGLHFLLLKNVLPPVYEMAKPELIYLFLIPVQFAGLGYLVYRFLKNQTAVMQSYLLFASVKLVGAVLFLSGWIFDKNEFTNPFIAQFFCVFFPLLFAEIAFLVKILNASERNI